MRRSRSRSGGNASGRCLGLIVLQDGGLLNRLVVVVIADRALALAGLQHLRLELRDAAIVLVAKHEADYCW